MKTEVFVKTNFYLLLDVANAFGGEGYEAALRAIPVLSTLNISQTKTQCKIYTFY